MATTTKRTTKAKTKTSRAKTTNKTSSAKSTASKAAAAKKVKKETKAAKVPRPTLITTVQTLRNLNLFAGALFVLLAVVAGFVMGDSSRSLMVGYLAPDDLNNSVLAPAARSIYDLEIRWAVVAVMVLSAILPILYVTRLQKRYEEYLNNTRMVPFRWFDFAITFGLMVEITALLSGVQDLAVLKLIVGIVVVSYLLGLIAERQNNNATQPVTSAYYTGLFASILPWLVIAAYAIFTWVYGATTSPWYVYALYGVGIVGVLWVALNQRRQIKNKARSYLATERGYLLGSILVKAAFAVVLIVGLR